MARLKLADTSAWHRARHPQVAAAWRRAVAGELLATTEMVRLEILYSARSGAEYESIAMSLHGLLWLQCDRSTMHRALEVQRLLAHHGGLHHRVPTPDLVIAAVAESHGATVWHYDADYDRIAEVTGQPMEWVAPRGTL